MKELSITKQQRWYHKGVGQDSDSNLGLAQNYGSSDMGLLGPWKSL